MHFWDQKRDQGVDWWLSHFAPEPGIVKGEITPAYAILDACTVWQIRAAAPDVRLFYSIRNPIARAWSSALMGLSRAEMELDEASDQWFIDHFQSRGSRRRGHYLACLDVWLSVFSEQSMRLILLDDIIADPRSTLRELAEHLRIDPRPFERLDDSSLRQKVFAGPKHPVRPVLLEYLRAMYRPQIQRLSDRLSRNLAMWMEETP